MLCSENCEFLPKMCYAQYHMIFVVVHSCCVESNGYTGNIMSCYTLWWSFRCL